MTPRAYIYIGILLCVATLGAYLAWGHGCEGPTTVDRQVPGPVQEHVVYRDRVITRTVTVTSKPDGTTTTTTTDSTEEKAKDSNTITPQLQPLPNYSLALRWHRKYTDLIPWMKPDWKELEVVGSRRLFELPLHGEIGYRPGTQELSLGVRYDF